MTDVPFFLVLIFKSIDCCSEHAKLLVLAENCGDSRSDQHKLLRQKSVYVPIHTFVPLW